MGSSIVVAAFYEFAPTPKETLIPRKQGLLDLCCSEKIKGTILLGEEGINGTVAGPREGIDKLHKYFITHLGLVQLTYKESFCEKMPFLRMKVKIKKEIVTIGLPDINPNETVGTYVKPKAWNALINDPDVLVLDTRNDYEVAIGSFANAQQPHTKNFREFPDFVNRQLDPAKHKKVAMFCTGGIRCEKASAYMLKQGFENVYHLEGGILQYLEDIDESESLWQGACFVFDERVAVNHQLAPDQYTQCYGCRHPLTPEEANAAQTIKGVCCPYCYKTTSADQKARYAQRQKQIDLAKQRGKTHLAPGHYD